MLAANILFYQYQEQWELACAVLSPKCTQTKNKKSKLGIRELTMIDADRCIRNDELEVVDSLDETARGDNGFGSSGR